MVEKKMRVSRSVNEAGYGVYMDHHASTPIDPRVLDEMMPFMTGGFGNPHSADHGYGWQADAAVERARAAVAAVIGAFPEEIIFTSGATESNNLALIGVARAAPASRRRIVVTAIEHKCVLGAARALKSEGFEVIEAPVTHDGIVSVSALTEIINDSTAIVSVMAMNNEVGSVQPLSEIAALCQKHGALSHSDAAQALSVAELDVDALGVDLLSLSAHKAYGPKGVGALYVRTGARDRIRPITYGGHQEDGLRPGTVPTFLCVGFGAACRAVMSDRDADATRMRGLRNRLLERLAVAEKGVILNGPRKDRHAGNLNVRVDGLDADLVLAAARPLLAASTGSACTSGLPEPSHVLRAMGLDARAANESIRLSLGRFTKADDVDKAAEALARAFAKVRSGR